MPRDHQRPAPSQKLPGLLRIRHDGADQVTGIEREVVIVGAGPAGISAACVVAETGRSALLIDDNPSPGGQIWREQDRHGSDWQASHWLRRMHLYRVDVMSGATVIDGDPGRRAIVCETANSVSTIRYKKLILATGARELFLPFPGWTLPNVMGAGGLQALAKSGLPIAGKRIVVACSGPLLLAVAKHLRDHGARVALIAEQASHPSVIAFGLRLARHPGKLAQAIGLRTKLAGLRYLTSCWPVAAQGGEKLESVTLRRLSTTWSEPCD